MRLNHSLPQEPQPSASTLPNYFSNKSFNPASTFTTANIPKLHRSLAHSNSSRTHSLTSLKFSTASNPPVYKDPGQQPICDKSARFEQNYSFLPETRLKLLVNEKILKMDQQAVERISLKLEEENKEENNRIKKHYQARIQLISAYENRKKRTKDLQARTGLVMIKSMPLIAAQASKRIQSLSMPKSVKKGYAGDYIDSFGLLTAGVIESGRSVLPKSSRVPKSLNVPSFPIHQSLKSKTFANKLPDSKYPIYSSTEILECMKEINEFHRRFGELKGRVGFPQIDLEKYKNKIE